MPKNKGCTSSLINAFRVLPHDRLVSGSSDADIKVWDIRTNKCLQTMESSYGVRDITLLNNGSFVSIDFATIKAWDPGTFACLQTLPHKSFCNSKLTTLQNGLLVSGSKDQTIIMWDTRTYKRVHTLQHSDFVTALTTTHDGHYLVSGSEEKGVRIWDIRTYKCLQTLPHRRVGILTVLHNDHIVSGSDHTTVKIWDHRTFQCVKILKEHRAGVGALTVTPDGDLVSGSGDGYMKIWNNRSYQCMLTQSLGSDINVLTMLPDRRLVSGSFANTIRLWELPTLPFLMDIMQITAEPQSVMPYIELSSNYVGSPLHGLTSPSPELSSKVGTDDVDVVSKGKQPISEDDLNEDMENLLLEKPVNPLKPPSSHSPSSQIAELQPPKLPPESHSQLIPPPSDLGYLIPSKDLQLGEQLEGGGFGIVYKGKYKSQQVAIKKLRNQTPSPKDLDAFEKEIAIIASLKSNYIVEFIGACLEPLHYSLVMEYMPNGSLYTLLASQHPIPWDIRVQMIEEIAQGLDYLHARGIIHCDLRSHNVLLDINYRAKIGDFGLSKVRSPNLTYSTNTGAQNFYWQAPELVAPSAKPTAAADVYSFAMVMFEICSRKIPFFNLSIIQLVGILKDGGNHEVQEKQNMLNAIEQETPPFIRELIIQCWDRLERNRPPVRQVLYSLQSKQLFFSKASTKSEQPAQNKQPIPQEGQDVKTLPRKW